MAHALHDGEARPGDGRGHRLTHRRRAGIVVFASEQRHLAAVCIDVLDVVTTIPIYAVEVDVMSAFGGKAGMPNALRNFHQ
jgi:hypothetical protein